MHGWQQIVALVATSGFAGWFGPVLFQWGRSLINDQAQNRRVDLDIEEHRDALTFDLIEAARIDVRQLREEVQRLRPLESHLVHFEEALAHLERLLLTPRDAENRQEIEDNARAFVNRMRRHAEASGVIRNEIARLDAATGFMAKHMGRRWRNGEDEEDSE